MSVRPLGNVNGPEPDQPITSAPVCGRSGGLVYLTAAALVVVDQAAKVAADHWLRPLGSAPIASWLSLTWATNTGGAFGVFSADTALLAVVAIVVVAALVVIAPRLGAGRLLAVAVASVMGGALGNLIDRVRIGYVIDYIDVHFWPVFNIADIAITVGAGLLIIATFIAKPHCCCIREDSD